MERPDLTEPLVSSETTPSLYLKAEGVDILKEAVAAVKEARDGGKLGELSTLMQGHIPLQALDTSKGKLRGAWDFVKNTYQAGKGYVSRMIDNGASWSAATLGALTLIGARYNLTQAIIGDLPLYLYIGVYCTVGVATLTKDVINRFSTKSTLTDLSKATEQNSVRGIDMQDLSPNSTIVNNEFKDFNKNDVSNFLRAYVALEVLSQLQERDKDHKAHLRGRSFLRKALGTIVNLVTAGDAYDLHSSIISSLASAKVIKDGIDGIMDGFFKANSTMNAEQFQSIVDICTRQLMDRITTTFPKEGDSKLSSKKSGCVSCLEAARAFDIPPAEIVTIAPNTSRTLMDKRTRDRGDRGEGSAAESSQRRDIEEGPSTGSVAGIVATRISSTFNRYNSK